MTLGVDVCMSCFGGFCSQGSTNSHGVLHHQKTGHSVFVNIKRTRKAVVKNKRVSPLQKLPAGSRTDTLLTGLE